MMNPLYKSIASLGNANAQIELMRQYNLKAEWCVKAPLMRGYDPGQIIKLNEFRGKNRYEVIGLALKDKPNVVFCGDISHQHIVPDIEKILYQNEDQPVDVKSLVIFPLKELTAHQFGSFDELTAKRIGCKFLREVDVTTLSDVSKKTTIQVTDPE